MKIKFTKMQAFGNDYVYIDAIHQEIVDPNRLAEKVSDRHYGMGSDGMVMICPSTVCDFRMRIFDPDGTEAEMCGNALRSTAKFVYHYHLTSKTDFTIETLGGNQTVHLLVEDNEVVNITADIGKPELRASKVPVITDQEIFLDQPLHVLDKTYRASCVSWGNPHTVLLEEHPENLDIETYGPTAETHELFPERTNVTFAKPVDESHITIREWERRCGETLGCGTGCCSAVVVFHRMGLCGRSVDVLQPGGTLHVDWDENDVIHMTGPSHIVYEGEYFYETE